MHNEGCGRGRARARMGDMGAFTFSRAIELLSGRVERFYNNLSINGAGA